MLPFTISYSTINKDVTTKFGKGLIEKDTKYFQVLSDYSKCYETDCYGKVREFYLDKTENYPSDEGANNSVYYYMNDDISYVIKTVNSEFSYGGITYKEGIYLLTDDGIEIRYPVAGGYPYHIKKQLKTLMNRYNDPNIIFDYSKFKVEYNVTN